MKKLIVLTVLLLGLLFNQAVSQTVAEDVNVTATVISSLSITSTDVAFGNINSGSPAYVNAGDAADETTNANASAPQNGSLTIAGDNAASLSVTWGTASLTDNDGLNATTFTPTVVWGGEVRTTGSSITLDVSGDGSILIGGALDATNAGTGLISTANDGGTPLTFTFVYD